MMLRIAEITMCLLKVYLKNEDSSQKLIAEEIAIVAKEDGKVRIRNLNMEEKTLDNVEILLIDALNSVLLLENRKD